MLKSGRLWAKFVIHSFERFLTNCLHAVCSPADWTRKWFIAVRLVGKKEVRSLGVHDLCGVWKPLYVLNCFPLEKTCAWWHMIMMKCLLRALFKYLKNINTTFTYRSIYAAKAELQYMEPIKNQSRMLLLHFHPPFWRQPDLGV